MRPPGSPVCVILPAMEVRLDLYPDAETGAYAVEVRAAPAGLASPNDLPAGSANLVLDGAPARPGAHSLLFTQAVPSPVVADAFARRDYVLSAYRYHPRDEVKILAFDARITRDYAAFYAARGA